VNLRDLLVLPNRIGIHYRRYPPLNSSSFIDLNLFDNVVYAVSEKEITSKVYSD
jgi:hypothetical protein